MANYINREALINKQQEANDKLFTENERLKKLLEEFRAADVAPVRHGKWTPVKYNAHCSCGKSYGTYHFLCSACNHIAYSQPNGLNYCPNCGAKMDGDE